MESFVENENGRLRSYFLFKFVVYDEFSGHLIWFSLMSNKYFIYFSSQIVRSILFMFTSYTVVSKLLRFVNL